MSKTRQIYRNPRILQCVCFLQAVACLAITIRISGAQEVEPVEAAPATSTSPSENTAADQTDTPNEPPRLPAPQGAQAMPKPYQVWIDVKKKVVYVDGYVSLNEGMLEMFACPQGTKEHESIVAVYSSAQVVHAALLAVGAKPGHPVRWDPKFEPAAGTEIDIEVHWRDEADKWHKLRAQEWVQEWGHDLKTKQPMSHAWVFAGSGFWEDEETGDQYYMAEGGELICVSNFSTATLDLPVESSQANQGLLFEANTEKIPPIGTPVRLVLKPKLEKLRKLESKP